MSFLEVKVNLSELENIIKLLENPPGCALEWHQDTKHLDENTVETWTTAVIGELRKLTCNIPAIHASVLKLGQWVSSDKHDYPSFYTKAQRIYKSLLPKS